MYIDRYKSLLSCIISYYFHSQVLFFPSKFYELLILKFILVEYGTTQEIKNT